MSVRFLIGRSGTGKTTFCEEEIKTKLKENPAGDPLIYIVPDQMTFDTEYSMASTPGLNGMTRLNVYSFSRLALRVLQSVGGITRYHLSNVGISMLLRKIIEHEFNELKVFQKASKQRGFYDLLGETITEFKRYCVTPDSLRGQYHYLNNSHHAQGTELLKDKLHDLNLIYEKLDEALIHKYIDSEDYLQLLTDRLHLDDSIREAEVWIDGFNEFTPQELQVIQKLMQNAKRVTIALTRDETEQTASDLSLFRQANKTHQRLYNIANEVGVITEDPVTFSTKHRFKSSEIEHIEQHYEKRPIKKGPYNGNVQVIEAVNRRTEVEHTARKIIELVRDHRYRYRDISVMTRDLSSYEGLFQTIFNDYDIPVFIDQKHSMKHHPVIEFVRSLLDTVDQNWRYEAVFRCIKTDLLFPVDSNLEEEREGMALLENIVIAYGIYGDKWKERRPWVYKKYRGLDHSDHTQNSEELAYQKKMNRLRLQVVDPLSDFEEKIKKATTVKEKSTVLYRFLESMAIPEKIEKLRDTAEANGKLDEAREHDQVWQALIDVLDQLVETGGDESITFSEYVKIIDTGLESMKFALVPPALDQLMIGSLDRSRHRHVKATFILGVNDGVIPARPTETGLLSDEDREALELTGMTLAPDTKSLLLDEEFLIYRALTSASDRLIISYPIATEEGQTLLPSQIIGRLKQFFPNLDEVFAVSEPHEAVDSDQLHFITNPSRTLSFMASQVRQWTRGYPISDVWWDSYNWLITRPIWRERTRKVMRSLFDLNVEKPLEKQTIQTLYGDTITASVSRMERFNSCPFSQFVSYGLKLQERDVFRLDAPDIGQLFHSALSMVSKKLQAMGKNWGDLSKDECRDLTGTIIEQLAPKLQREILLSSNRYHYLQHKLQQVVERAVLTLSEHARSSGFYPIGLELPFGPNQPLPSLQFDLPSGQRMEIVGRIDRVDQGQTKQGMLLRVIDYKSSEKDLRFIDIYYGLALQMLTYLDVVLTHAKVWLGKEAHPAGVLYFHVHNPMLQSTETLSAEAIESKLLKEFKMKGLLIADEDVVREMDQQLDTGYSDILPVALKKDGSFYSNSSVITGEEMSGLREYVHTVIKKVGERLSEGDISISPYKLNNQTPCQFCSYKSICQFDMGRQENNYRALAKLKEETILEEISKGGGDHDEPNDEEKTRR